MTSPWTNPEVTEQLKLLVAGGYSYAHIGAQLSSQFNVCISRNAAIGRAGRLGLFPSAPKKAKVTPRERTPRPKIIPAPKADPSHHSITVIRRCNGNSDTMRLTQTTVTDFRLRCVEIEPLHLTLMQLESNSCRYPYGGDRENEAFTFCGHPSLKDKPYCRSHSALTYQEPKPPKERPYVGRYIARVAV